MSFWYRMAILVSFGLFVLSIIIAASNIVIKARGCSQARAELGLCPQE
ncbi:hypothetical protein KW791_02595 [Candidatus Parcubacteria bacterium]|nr:hypothetical protein [Candidatus Parcubacteria bacterium]